ncbi:hypothetical protein WA026_010098 [Henosepilachna vigintioctopunctata]|uniref:Uncharacterized protein n=1 Tax=Henosepilachna vigintioctopunctata TaxID=420089 RepID=A0AAW1UHP3_9CUCU
MKLLLVSLFFILAIVLEESAGENDEGSGFGLLPSSLKNKIVSSLEGQGDGLKGLSQSLIYDNLNKVISLTQKGIDGLINLTVKSIDDDIQEGDNAAQKDVVSEGGNKYPLNEAILNEVLISSGEVCFFCLEKKTEADSDDILFHDEDEDSEDDNTEMGL